MSRTGPFRLLVTAALFGLLFTGLASIGLVKAAHNFPHRAAVASGTAHSDHLALLIANSSRMVIWRPV